LPGLDPESDVDVSVANGMLHIAAKGKMLELRADEEHPSEPRYKWFIRDVRLTEGTSQDDIAVTYKDGFLEIRVTRTEELPTIVGQARDAARDMAAGNARLPAEPRSSISLGYPQCVELKRVPVGEASGLASVLGAGEATFFLVHLACSFAAAARERFVRASLSITLVPSETTAASQPVAWSMQPLCLPQVTELARAEGRRQLQICQRRVERGVAVDTDGMPDPRL
jgi:hypothetical protein